VCTIQDTALLEYPEILGGPETDRERTSIATWLDRSHRVVVSSNSTREHLERIYGPNLPPMDVIPHAILPGDAPACARQASRATPEMTGLPPRYVLCLTNITAHKNLDTLMVAWSRFSGRRSTPLVVTGLGTDVLDDTRPFALNLGYQQDRLSGLIRRLGLKRQVDLFGLGYVSDATVASLLRGAWALISPSLLEGGGSFPVEEALGSSVPVLCSDIPVMREHLAQRASNVLWFDPLSVPSIVSALERLTDEYSTWKRAAVEAAHMPRPGWAEVASAYVDVFESVLAGGSRESGRRA
jgi:glycosyltransferase involved in cell wall biosynthesis